MVVPDRFTGRRVGSDDNADDGAHIEETVDHDRCVLVVPRSARDVREVAEQRFRHAGNTPSNLQITDRVAIDPIERRIFGAGLVRPLGRPISGDGRLDVGHARRDGGETRDGDEAGKRCATHLRTSPFP